jgi:uncharacterized protein (DUF1697 family)
MADLAACFREAGFVDVTTYIQSGNVVFTVDRVAAREELTRRIEVLLGDAFHYRASVVLRTHEQMRGIVTRSPVGFGSQPDGYRYDVIFLKEPLTAATAMKTVPAKPGVDEAHAGKGVLYFSRLASKSAQSHLSRLTSLPVYRSMTIRNWNTTTTLLQRMGG